jgi:hypothetical protein
MIEFIVSSLMHTGPSDILNLEFSIANVRSILFGHERVSN